jgi:Kdo2-lipid IVA lauroyltransferase/acyltransferase
MSRKNPVLQAVEYGAYRAVARLVRNASDARIQKWGTRFGAASRRVLRGRDRLAMRNLRAAFPEKDATDLRTTLDAAWRHFGREMLEYVRMQSMSMEEIVERCPFVNADLVEAGLARGKGVVLISAHWGGWEVAGLVITALTKDVRTVARVLDNEYLERDLARMRAKTGVEVIDRRKAARPLMKGLAENALVVMLPDQAVKPREGILVPFLGRPAWTTDAPAKLALRHGSTIVFAFCIPDGTRHRLEFEEAIRVDQLPPAEQDPAALTTRINDVISRRIAARPDLWLWMHDRWKWTGESEVQHG